MKGENFVELRQLEYFLMVSKLKNFTRAAEKLYISQPAITSSINTLETELGVKLFRRSKRRIELTTEGRTFYNYVNVVMNDVDNMFLEMNNLREKKKGLIKVAVDSWISASHFFPIYRKFSYKYPDTKINFISCDQDRIQYLLKSEGYDLAIVLGNDDEYTKSCMKILEGEIQAFSTTPLKNSKEISYLCDNDILLMDGEYSFNKKILDHFDKNEMNILCKASCSNIIEEVLLDTHAVALLPDCMIFQSDTIQKYKIKPSIRYSLNVIWQEESATGSVKNFIDGFYEYYNNERRGLEIGY